MRNSMIAAVLLAGASLAACGGYEKNEYNEANASYDAEGADYNGTAGGGYNTTAAGNWPEGARIVEENHVYYRVEPSGTRVGLNRATARSSSKMASASVSIRAAPVSASTMRACIRVGPDGVEANVPVDRDTSVTVNTQ